MKSSSAYLSVAARVLLLSFGASLVSCKESPQWDQEDDDSTTTQVQQEPPTVQERVSPGEGDPSEDSGSSDEKIAELRREIESRQQNVEDIEAFIQMERAKLKEDSDYNRTFLLDALDEQREIKDMIESDKKRLELLRRHGRSG